MTLAAGTRFGPYEITAPLGAGGMGEVYRARDTALKRDVAIKVLPAALASDAERLERFQREAELLAALNHPNIAQIYGLERSDGTTALAMELVAGQSLVERLARGALPVDEALAVAGQIADALEAAHERGIVHRDLKPANIQLRPDGTVKVLDFGIAKALVTSTTHAGPAALTTPAMTEVGIVLGTAAYMSPEQARGGRVDQRADIWAFGCVLYELLTGQLAFGGDDVTRELERGPDFAPLPASAPAAVRRTLELCLEKDPKKRIADIRDVKLSLAGRFALTAPVKRRDGSWLGPMIAAAVVLALGAVVGGFAAWSSKPEERTVVRGIHRLPEGVLVRGLAGRALAVSPDGSAFVYTGPDAFYLRRMDTIEDRRITGSPGEADLLNANPTFSPDGRSLAYFHAGQLRRLAVAGGASTAIASVESIAQAGISWETDGTILYAQGRGGGIWRVAEAGGSPTRVVAAEAGQAMAPQLLPGGEWILYTVFFPANSATEIRVASVATGEQRTLRTNAASARYVATGHLLYVTGGVLYAAPFDVRGLQFSGAHVPVVEGVRALIGGVGQYDVAATGTLVYLQGRNLVGEAADVAVLVDDLSGSALPTNVPRGRYGRVRAAPDGERIALDSDDRGEAIIWLSDLAGSGTLQRVTFEGRNQFPVWSPEGERIAFQSTRGGDLGLWVQRVDGTDQAQRLTTPSDGEAHIPEDWSPDGEFLSVSIERNGLYSLALLSLRDRMLIPLNRAASQEPTSSSFSSDSRWIAYHLLPPEVIATSPSAGVFVESVLLNGAFYQVPRVARDFQPVWAQNSLDLFYIPSAVSGQIARVRAATGRGLSFGMQTLLPFDVGAQRLSSQTRAFDVLPDGRFIGLGLDLADAPLGAPEVHFVVNWFEELERLVPTE
jgi:eukaryotic-like serine/threonine-protein kinase